MKPAPQAYGVKNEPHYYFINTYNCIYQCEYCYLQGYFSSPDIVCFINYQDIGQAILETSKKHTDKVWFHAGEFSDSLALSHITGECDFYYELFKKIPNAYLELRTKSANIRELKKKPPLSNVITSFSLSSEEQIDKYDHKTARLSQRLKAMKELSQLGHPLAIHFDPLIYVPHWQEKFKNLIEQVQDHIPIKSLLYISLGTVRFTKEVYNSVQKNYPTSSLWHEEMVKTFDGKMRYIKPLRMKILNEAKEILLNHKAPENGIYFCME